MREFPLMFQSCGISGCASGAVPFTILIGKKHRGENNWHSRIRSKKALAILVTKQREREAFKNDQTCNMYIDYCFQPRISSASWYQLLLTRMLESIKYLAMTDAFASSRKWKTTLLRSATRSKLRVNASANFLSANEYSRKLFLSKGCVEHLQVGSKIMQSYISKSASTWQILLHKMWCTNPQMSASLPSSFFSLVSSVDVWQLSQVHPPSLCWSRSALGPPRPSSQRAPRFDPPTCAPPPCAPRTTRGRTSCDPVPWPRPPRNQRRSSCQPPGQQKMRTVRNQCIQRTFEIERVLFHEEFGKLGRR